MLLEHAKNLLLQVGFTVDFFFLSFDFRGLITLNQWNIILCMTQYVTFEDNDLPHAFYNQTYFALMVILNFCSLHCEQRVCV